ncbi:alpha/beta fold hydrolase [Cupriavidus agavae]|uniref:Pimeloyl-ACP methyl ester carboxylesterase n=1 Tax=Cupriavidus agavae TaxID=1001822 RepID=A0A4Q7RSW7_9BURK|nr:alpha/beta hydrolase [Cupriavidus agavae]RZT35452.1 pimeloyl-ACP methyl ester carboxylesterase [Cupriavidus agavae]
MSDSKASIAIPLGAILVACAATALWVRHRAANAERQSPPSGHMLHIDGVRLHYTDRGEVPAVVLLHGNGVQLEDFTASGLVDSLARRHRVIAFDRPGFGYTERPRRRIWTPQAQATLLWQALRQLGVERPIIVGHSWGTLTAIAMGLAEPEEVSGLVLVSGYYYPTARPDVLFNIPGALPLVGDVLRYTLLPLAWRLGLARGVRTMFAPAPVPPDFLDIVPREMMLRPIQLRAASEEATSMIPAVSKLRKSYHQLTMPVAIIAGRDDTIVDVSRHSERLHHDIPHSTLTVEPGAGHMVHHSHALAVVNAVSAQAGTGLHLVVG